MNKEYIELCDVKDCTGCFACENACRQSAIIQIKNEEGFRYPKILHEKCISCHACQRVCPVLSPLEKFEAGKVYAAWNKDETVRSQSSSGGMFSILASVILREKGIVVGASLCDDGYVRHIAITEEKQLKKLRGSKYVQSLLSVNVYAQIKEYLSQGKKVLFSGTPCQVIAMRKTFKRYSELFYTVDLVCHGVPSPDFFAEFYKKLKKQIPNMVSYQFRDYKNWLVCTNVNVNVNVNGRIYNRYLYGKPTFYQDAFLKGYLHRENCYHCQYTSKERVSDITLADFWGIGKVKPIDKNYKGGCSMVSVNSQKGSELMEAVKEKIFYELRDIQETIDGGNEQIVKPSNRPSERDDFYKDAKVMSWRKLIKKYNLNLREKATFCSRVKHKIKYFLVK